MLKELRKRPEVLATLRALNAGRCEIEVYENRASICFGRFCFFSTRFDFGLFTAMRKGGLLAPCSLTQLRRARPGSRGERWMISKRGRRLLTRSKKARASGTRRRIGRRSLRNPVRAMARNT
jgi:hypothetical protein